MHPAVIIIPAAALIFAPRLWVRHVLKRHNQKDIETSGTASEVARALLDRRNLQVVKVECTDIGDHYDPEAKSLRLTRDKFDRKTLTAITTAAHEVGHALQDADNYAPFVWRLHLVKVARAAGEVGTVMLLSVPVAAVLTRNPAPAFVIGLAALGILGTGMAVQLVTLPTEFDASFNRAIGMLEEGYVRTEHIADARKILLACSLTYVASSLISVLNVWPWLPRVPLSMIGSGHTLAAAAGVGEDNRPRRRKRISAFSTPRARRAAKYNTVVALVRQITKPAIRGWLQLSRSVQNPIQT